jgi:hypothetical protein
VKELVESSIDCQYCESLGKGECWLCEILLAYDLLALGIESVKYLLLK